MGRRSPMVWEWRWYRMSDRTNFIGTLSLSEAKAMLAFLAGYAPGGFDIARDYLSGAQRGS